MFDPVSSGKICVKMFPHETVAPAAMPAGASAQRPRGISEWGWGPTRK
jgi:hypothetical protein